MLLKESHYTTCTITSFSQSTLDCRGSWPLLWGLANSYM